MQHPIQFQKANALQSMQGVSRAISLPHEHYPTRLPSFPALERTAVMAFNVPRSWSIPPVAASFSGLENGKARALLTRQPSFPLWLDQSLSQSAPLFYWVTYPPEVVYLTPDIHLIQATPWYGGTNNFAVSPGFVGTVTYSSFSKTANTSTILGHDAGLGGRPFLYVPAGASLYVYGALSSVITTNVTMHLGLEQWANPGQQTATERTICTFTGTAGSAQLWGYMSPFEQNTWLRPSTLIGIVGAPTYEMNMSLSYFVISGTAALTPSATLYGGALVFTAGSGLVPEFLPAFVSPDFTTSRLPFMDTRLTAVAALFTNVSKVLDKEGTILCARLAPETIDVFNFDETPLSMAHPSEKSFLAMEHGAYSYCPPSSDLANFWDYTYEGYTSNNGGSAVPNRVSNGWVAPVYRLDNSSLVNAFVFSDRDVTTVTSFAINCDFHLEFRTTSQLWPIGLSTLTLEQLHQAQLALVTAGFFFSNESHTSTIRKIIGNIARWGSTAARIASKVSPVAGIVSEAGSRIADVIDPRSLPVVRQSTTPPSTTLPLPKNLGADRISRSPSGVVAYHYGTRHPRPVVVKKKKVVVRSSKPRRSNSAQSAPRPRNRGR